MSAKIARSNTGFSVLELMVSVAVLVVITGAVLSSLTTYQNTYLSMQMKTDMYSAIRSAAELMSQEIGQAGLLSLRPRQLSAAVIASSTAQAVSVSPTTNYFFVGQKLLIDTGAGAEVVALTAVSPTTISGIFTKNHSLGAPIDTVGVFPGGVLTSSTATQLQLLGDINADGTVHYVRYDCDAAGGTLKRSSTPITASSSNTPQVVIENLTANPGGTPCFSYTSTTAAGFTFVTSVVVTLTTQTSAIDPQTRAFQTLTKSLNLDPRNVLAGLELANASLTDRLQPTPPGIPLP